VRPLLVIALLAVTGCRTSAPVIPPQPEAPTQPGIIADLGKKWDVADQKVAAAVTVARENADKPEVVKAETGVALSFLPKPEEAELALARQRTKGDQKEYATTMAFGQKLLAQLDADFDKVEKANAEAKRVSDLKDARIVALVAEVERVKKDAAANLWTLAGVAVAVIGAIATAFVGPKVGIPLLACGAAIGAFPFVVDSPYFAYIAASSLAIVAALGIWYLWDKVRDKVHESDEQPKA
jgi:hypothetical protein